MTYEEKMQIFEKNRYLVYSIVNNHWSHYYIELDDLTQEGMTILWDIIDNYDRLRNVAFSTYAYPVISNKLGAYARQCRFGRMAKSSYLEDVLPVVRYFREHGVSLSEACDIFNLSAVKREYAQIIATHSSLLVSLSAPECEDTFSSKTTLAVDEFENTICNKIDDERLICRLYTDFVDYCVQKRRGKVPDYYEPLIKCFLDSIFFVKTTQLEIGQRLNISRVVTNKNYTRFRSLLKDYLLTNELVIL